MENVENTENSYNLQKIAEEVRSAAEELLEKAQYTRRGDFFVLGCSSSEIIGQTIGQASSREVGRAVIQSLLPVVQAHGLYLAVQGCEHINRALSIDRAALDAHPDLEVVSVVPALHAGGAASMAAWENFAEPLCVEHLSATVGMDIGDTEIAMHVRFVQKPIRLSTKYVGQARVTALIYRPKLVGGERATYKRTF